MESILWILLPAVATALIVRGHALVVMPYFALSELLPGTPRRLKGESFVPPRALLARLLWPICLGFGLAWAPLYRWEIVISGVLSAIFILWPLAIYGFPWELTKRKWHLYVLYSGFIVSYGALSYFGESLQSLLLYVAEDDLQKWATENLLSMLLAFILTTIIVPIYKFSIDGIIDDKNALARYQSTMIRHLQNRNIQIKVQRIERYLNYEMGIEWVSIVRAIFLVESLERPPSFRFFEWLVQVISGRMNLTCGPLQLKNAPMRLKLATEEAVRYLQNKGVHSYSDWECIARAWHGAASRQPGASISYSQALSAAHATVTDGNEG